MGEVGYGLNRETRCNTMSEAAVEAEHRQGHGHCVGGCPIDGLFTVLCTV